MEGSGSECGELFVNPFEEVARLAPLTAKQFEPNPEISEADTT